MENTNQLHINNNQKQTLQFKVNNCVNDLFQLRPKATNENIIQFQNKTSKSAYTFMNNYVSHFCFKMKCMYFNNICKITCENNYFIGKYI